MPPLRLAAAQSHPASAGQPRRQQRSTTGAALRIARRAKERTYPELLRAERCRLVVLGIELGGRRSPEVAQFVRMLARSRARSAPHVLRSGATAAYVSRWSALLSFAAARAVAASLLSLPLGNAASVDGAALDLSDVLAKTFFAPPLASGLPLGLAVSCGCFPAVDFSCLDFRSVPRVALEFGFPSCLALGPRIGRKRSDQKKQPISQSVIHRSSCEVRSSFEFCSIQRAGRTMLNVRRNGGRNHGRLRNFWVSQLELFVRTMR